jgi:hypothetical protein
MQTNYFLYIDQYIKNELSEDEKVNFEIELNTDPELLQAVAEQRKILDGFEEIRIREKVKKVLKKRDTSAVLVPINQQRWSSYAIAASLLLTVGFAWWSLRPKPKEDIVIPIINPKTVIDTLKQTPSPKSQEEMVHQSPKKIEKNTPINNNIEPKQGPNLPEPNLEAIAFEAKALSIFEERIGKIGKEEHSGIIPNQDNAIEEAKVFLKNRDCKAAILKLESLKNSGYNQNECDWWLAIANLKENPAKAILQLENIINTGESMYVIAAKRVLSQLKEKE